jgi:hypothetical protein
MGMGKEEEKEAAAVEPTATAEKAAEAAAPAV